jgi:hypothetical protein
MLVTRAAVMVEIGIVAINGSPLMFRKLLSLLDLDQYCAIGAAFLFHRRLSCVGRSPSRHPLGKSRQFNFGAANRNR